MNNVDDHDHDDDDVVDDDDLFVTGIKFEIWSNPFSCTDWFGFCLLAK